MMNIDSNFSKFAPAGPMSANKEKAEKIVDEFDGIKDYVSTFDNTSPDCNKNEGSLSIPPWARTGFSGNMEFVRGADESKLKSMSLSFEDKTGESNSGTTRYEYKEYDSKNTGLNAGLYTKSKWENGTNTLEMVRKDLNTGEMQYREAKIRL